MVSVNTHCRICRSTHLEKFLSLGEQPLANRFLRSEQLTEPEPAYPLEVYWCPQCSLVQLIHVVGKEELFRHYIYFSSGMPRLSDHFRQYALDVMDRFLQPGDFVLEIASNDGVLLKFFKDSGYHVLGVDPAVNVVRVAEDFGVSTINDFFSESLARQLSTQQGKARAILANNVVAHINDHHDLLRGLAALLADDGVFVMEAPYLVDMFENLTYDTIYHEHLSYLAIRPLQVLFHQYGLEIFDVQIHSVQGQSIRVFAGKAGYRPVQPVVGQLVAKERALGLDQLSAYRRLAQRIQASKEALVALLSSQRQRGKRLAAYGAPAKGNTLLNYAKIGHDLLDYALEDLPSKQGLFTPGMHVPVVSREQARQQLPDYFLLLAWNYYKPILAKEQEFIRRGGKFILPVGDIIEIIPKP